MLPLFQFVGFLLVEQHTTAETAASHTGDLQKNLGRERERDRESVTHEAG